MQVTCQEDTLIHPVNFPVGQDVWIDVSPELPFGLVMERNGTIWGRPSESPLQDYTITVRESEDSIIASTTLCLTVTSRKSFEI